jgi:hypothetical protein
MARITYGRLEAALLKLGFVKLAVEGGVVYLEKATDTHITFPLMPADALVQARHLGVARTLVAGRVAAIADFERALEQAA